MRLKLRAQAFMLVTGVVAGLAHAQTVLRDSPVPGTAREAGYVQMQDGIRLAYVAYRPQAAARYPTVLWFDVYGAGSLPPLPMVMSWVERGYVFVGASSRGTGCSEGEYRPFNRLPEAKDGAALVEWAAAQSWSSGKVGLIGNSQPGILEFGIAALHPRHLAAIAAGGIVARTYADGWYPGGIYHPSIALHWSRIDQPGASRAAATLRIKSGDLDCKARAPRIAPNSMFDATLHMRHDGEFYRQSSPLERAPQIQVPALMVQSWTDPAVASSGLWVFERLASRHKRLFVLTGGHEAYLYSTSQEEVQRWMERWLKEEENGVDREPRVRIDFGTQVTAGGSYGDIPASKPAWTAQLSDWPPKRTQWRTLHLTADGKLGEQAPKGDRAGTREYFYPVGTELPGSNAQFALTPADGSALTYRSAPMVRDAAIIGSPQLRFFASSTQPDTDFMVALHDVAPNGDVTFIQRSYLRASRRAVDPKRSDAQLVFHPQLADEPLAPGEIYEFRLSIWPIAYVLRAGHALELLIAAPSSIPSPGFGLAPLMLPGLNTLYQDAAHPSVLRLPIVPGLEAHGPEPECGSLMFQPCRHAATEPKR